MDFSLEYSEEQEAFTVEVRKWLNENVPKELQPIRDTMKMSEEQWQLRRDFTRKLGQKGWLYPAYPKEYGGGGSRRGGRGGPISRNFMVEKFLARCKPIQR